MPPNDWVKAKGLFAEPPLPRNITKPVYDFDTVQVRTAIDNQADLQVLIGRLQDLLQFLPPSTAEAPQHD